MLGQDFSKVSTISLTVAAVNDAPLASAQSISLTRNNNAGITLSASDAEGDPITYTLVTSPTHGLVSGEVPNLLYSPAENFIGEDSFQFQASDSQGASTTATISLTVNPSNTAPLAESRVVTTSEENAVSINLIANDAENDALVYTITDLPTLTGLNAVMLSKAKHPSGETLTINATGTFGSLRSE